MSRVSNAEIPTGPVTVPHIVSAIAGGDAILPV